MRAIRAAHWDVTRYCQIFKEIAGKDPADILPERYTWQVAGGTNKLTKRREYLAEHGYAEAVAEADRRFLAEREAKYTPEEFEKRWQEHIQHMPQTYPKDAL